METTYNEKIVVSVTDQSGPALRNVQQQVDKAEAKLRSISSHPWSIIVTAVDKATAMIGSITTRALGLINPLTIPVKLGKIVGGAAGALQGAGFAAMGIGALAGAASGLGDVLGFGLASQMEQTQAQFMAFTKDAGKTAEILDLIKTRAALTPFSFQDMSTAAAAMLPVVKQSGIGLEDLMKQAEILAASNPMQGMEGASFSLREALTGDFTSIADRFNLSRSSINKWKAQGVSNFEIVQRAMAEMGFDSSLVANMGKTLNGRWSTFLDTLAELKRSFIASIFDRVSASLVVLQGFFDDNMDTMKAWAATAGAAIGNAADKFGTGVRRIVTGGQALWAAFTVDPGAIGIVLDQIRQMFGDNIADAIEPWAQAFMNKIPDIKSFVSKAQDTLNSLLAGDWKPLLNQAGDLAGQLQRWLGGQIASIDWKGIWGRATGIATGLGDSLAQVDWASAGTRLGASLGAMLKTALDELRAGGQFAQQLATNVQAMMAQVNWSAVGKSVTNMAVPFVVGFIAGLLGPDVWINLVTQHWDDLLTILFTIMFAPSRFAGILGAFLGRLPLVGMFLERLILMLNAVGSGIKGYIFGFLGDMTSTFLAGFMSIVAPAGESVGVGLIGSLRLGLMSIETSIGGWILEAAGWLGRQFGVFWAMNEQNIITIGGSLILGLITGMSNKVGDLFNWIKTQVTDRLPEFIRNALGIHSPSTVMQPLGEGIIMGIVRGLQSRLPDLASIMSAVLKSVGGFGGDVGALIQAAIAMTGVPASWASGLGIIIQGESGGNPMAANLTDVNAQAGNASVGLMQLTGTNRATYTPAGMDPLDPLAQIIAGIRYIQATYGDISRVPGVASVSSGGPYLPYDNGGYLPVGTSQVVNNTGHPEPVLTPGQWSRVSSGGNTFAPVIQVDARGAAPGVADELEARLPEIANRLLMLVAPQMETVLGNMAQA